MGKLFDKYAMLREGLIYDRDAYDQRLGVDPELISHGLEPVTEAELLGVKNFGQTSLDEIKERLVDHELSLKTLD